MNRVKDITGHKFDVKHCKGALKSYENALGSVKADKRSKFDMKIFLLLERLSKGGKISLESAPEISASSLGLEGEYPKEGKLPKHKGQHGVDFFYAVKKLPVRGYFWFSTRVSNTYFVSHYIKKDFDTLSKEDTEKVGNNWRRIEVDKHES